MDLDKLQDLVRLFESSSLCELEVEEEGRRITLRKAQPTFTQLAPVIAAAPQPVQVAPPVLESPAAKAAALEAANSASLAKSLEEEGLVTIDSPMVGVFYSAPAPSEPVFVKPGDTIEVNQPVCIVEAMKLMNEVTAKFRATVVKIMVENGEAVEYGQALFAVRKL